MIQSHLAVDHRAHRRTRRPARPPLVLATADGDPSSPVVRRPRLRDASTVQRHVKIPFAGADCPMMQCTIACHIMRRSCNPSSLL